MARRGWIYLRVVDGKGYCIGKTEDIARRDAEYTKENPFVQTVCTFEVTDIDKVERILISRTSHLRLLSNSREWLHHTDEVVAIVAQVRKRFALMTYAEWRELVRQRKERRLQQQGVEQVNTEQKTSTEQQPMPVATTLNQCPHCVTSGVSPYLDGYICRKCAFRWK